MRRLLTLNARYLAAAAVLLLIEVFIALRVHDRWIRPHGGDVLVVILIYCVVKAFLRVPVLPAVVGVLVFAYLVEFLQYLHFVDAIGLRHSRLAVVVLGASFEWLDIASYTLGAALILLFERVGQRLR